MINKSTADVKTYVAAMEVYSKQVKGSMEDTKKKFQEYDKKMGELYKQVEEAQDKLLKATTTEDEKAASEALKDLEKEVVTTYQGYVQENRARALIIKQLEEQVSITKQLQDRIEHLAAHDIDEVTKSFKATADGLEDLFAGQFRNFGSKMSKEISDKFLKKRAQEALGKMAGIRAEMAQHEEGSSRHKELTRSLVEVSRSFAEVNSTLSIAAGGIMMLAKLIMMASEQTAKFNLAMTKGIPLAGDLVAAQGNVSRSYVSTLKSLRGAMIDNNTEWLKLGMTSEEAMDAMNMHISSMYNSFIQGATDILNKPNVDQVVVKLVTSLQTYSKGLGTTIGDITELQNHFKYQLAMSTNSVTDAMNGLVDVAIRGGIQTSKFFSVFKDVLPNIGTYNNRLGETLGLFKALSRTMDPKRFQEAMQSLAGKSLSFGSVQEALPLAAKLTLSPTDVSKPMDIDIISKIFDRRLQDMVDQFGEGIKALATSPNIKQILGRIVADMLAKGKSPAEIDTVKTFAMTAEAMQNINKTMKSGMDETAKRSAAMPDIASFLTQELPNIRTQLMILNELSKKFGGTSMVGTGALRRQAVFPEIPKEVFSAVNEFNIRVSSVIEALKLNGKLTDKDSEVQESVFAALKQLNPNMKATPEEVKKLVKQLEKDERSRGALESVITDALLKAPQGAPTDLPTLEGLTKTHISETQSIGDYLQGYLRSMLEKLLNSINSIYEYLRSAVRKLFGFEDDDEKLRMALANSVKTFTEYGGDLGRRSTEFADFNRKLPALIMEGGAPISKSSLNTMGVDASQISLQDFKNAFAKFVPDMEQKLINMGHGDQADRVKQTFEKMKKDTGEDVTPYLADLRDLLELNKPMYMAMLSALKLTQMRSGVMSTGPIQIKGTTPPKTPAMPTDVPAKTTQMKPGEAKTAIEGALGVGPGANSPLVDMLLAHWAHETRKGVDMYNYNFGGVKPGKGYTGQTTVLRTDEGYGASKHTIRDRFRAFDTPLAGAQDYVNRLTKQWPGALEAAKAGNPEGFVDALRRGGYFTGDPKVYEKAIRSFYKEFHSGRPLSALPGAAGSISVSVNVRTDADPQEIAEAVAKVFPKFYGDARRGEAG